jgi:type I restriction enzyme S subunit
MTNAPEIRFKGFTDAWVQRKLGEVCAVIGGGTPDTSIKEYWNGDIDWYSPVEIGEQIYVYGSQKKITEIGLQKSSAKVLPIGTVLFTSRAGIGNTAILAKEGSTNQGFQSIVPYDGELDSYFIYSRTHELKRYGETNGAGSTFVEVSGKQMAMMPLLIPRLIEQTAIGNFFRTLDEAITAHKRKLDGLKELKKGYLQQMFPQAGERVPRVRFAGFTGDWDVKMLKNFIETSKEKNCLGVFSKCDVLSVSGEFGIVNQIQFQGRSFAGVSVSNYGVVNIGDIVYTKSPLKSNPYGIIKTNKGSAGIVSPLYAIYKPKNKVDSNFVQYYFELDTRLNGYLKPLVNKGAKNDMKINNDNVLVGSVTFPSYDEQIKISKFLHEFDNMIATQQTKLSKLKQLKSAYLQKMLI